MTELEPTERAMRSWDHVAPSWERNRERVFNGFLAVSQWLVDTVDPQPGQTVLEVAAGPGETGFLAAARVGATGRLVSTDLAPAMVAAAERGAAVRGLANVECRVLDGQDMDLPDASVDGVISRLGFMLMPDPGRALREVRRVLRPGGRLVYAVIGAPDRNQWLSLIMMAFVGRGHVPSTGDPFGPGGPFSLSAPDRNRELLSSAGFADVAIDELAGTTPFDGLDDYWAYTTAMTGPIAAIAAALPVEELEAIRSSLAATMEPFRSGDKYQLPSHLICVSAT